MLVDLLMGLLVSQRKIVNIIFIRDSVTITIMKTKEEQMRNYKRTIKGTGYLISFFICWETAVILKRLIYWRLVKLLIYVFPIFKFNF